MPDFSGRVVVVTGGGRGIGLATAEAFAAAGASVVVWDRMPADGARGRIEQRQVDVGSVAAVQQAAEQLLQQHGRVDVLVNNAGVNFGDQSATGIDDAVWDAMLGTNLRGTVHTVRALSPAMVRRQHGRIINTGSILGRCPVAGFGAYSAAKAAVAALTRAWARELGPHGITVNAVEPGLIDTPMNDGLGRELIEALVQRTPVGRQGRPADVAAVHMFLASDDACFVNGAVVPVDGGLTL